MDIVFTLDKKDIILTGTPFLFEPVHKILYLSPLRAAKPSAKYRQSIRWSHTQGMASWLKPNNDGQVDEHLWFVSVNFLIWLILAFFCGNKCSLIRVDVLLLWIFFIICVCLFLAAFWSTAWKGLTSWLPCILCFLVSCYLPIYCPRSGVVFDCIDS